MSSSDKKLTYKKEYVRGIGKDKSIIIDYNVMNIIFVIVYFSIPGSSTKIEDEGFRFEAKKYIMNKYVNGIESKSDKNLYIPVSFCSRTTNVKGVINNLFLMDHILEEKKIKHFSIGDFNIIMDWISKSNFEKSFDVPQEVNTIFTREWKTFSRTAKPFVDYNIQMFRMAYIYAFANGINIISQPLNNNYILFDVNNLVNRYTLYPMQPNHIFGLSHELHKADLAIHFPSITPKSIIVGQQDYLDILTNTYGESEKIDFNMMDETSGKIYTIVKTAIINKLHVFFNQNKDANVAVIKLSEGSGGGGIYLFGRNNDYELIDYYLYNLHDTGCRTRFIDSTMNMFSV